ncbi:Uncharacterised protein [Klebsiella variicola]|nr:Uncharacterised protein [Klebsiella variicola]SLW83548.1 Uncharacterised protein [Klebsiella variicola]SLY51209.1 Uncharacterised protein [Klebsiella variicola]SMA31843.1 Uncharacterised protein [Klebsiella variicola]SMA33067.1 Uncharacterised protein [Klebsiella variicola]
MVRKMNHRFKKKLLTISIGVRNAVMACQRGYYGNTMLFSARF